VIKKRNVVPYLFLLPALILVSCDSFFSASWGSKRAYDPDNIHLSINNLESWIEHSIGNPELAAAITKKIIEKVTGADPASADTATFQVAGVSLAVEASGIGELMISTAGDALGDIKDNKDTGIQDILGDIQEEFKSGGPQAAANLADIVGVSISGKADGSSPTFGNTAYASVAKAGDVSQAVLLLALAVLGDEGDIGEKVEQLGESDASGGIAGLKLDDTTGKVQIDTSKGEEASPEAVALAAYLNLIADDTNGKFDSNPITSAIKSAFHVGK
jgi:hypothetical protein